MMALWTFIKENLFVLAAVILVAAIVVFVYGCEATVQSIVNPEKRVNRAMLDAEVQYMTAQIQAKYQDLNKQEAFMQELTNQLSLFSQQGGINPGGVVSTAITLLSVGWGVQKHTQLATEKKKTKTLTDAANNVVA